MSIPLISYILLHFFKQPHICSILFLLPVCISLISYFPLTPSKGNDGICHWIPTLDVYLRNAIWKLIRSPLSSFQSHGRPHRCSIFLSINLYFRYISKLGPFCPESKLQCNLNQNTTLIAQENQFENVCILSQPQCINKFAPSFQWICPEIYNSSQ